MPKTFYDPYIYAYMRALGYPREHYCTYMRELGFMVRAPRPPRKRLPTFGRMVEKDEPRPHRRMVDSRYPAWATDKVRVLATRYAKFPATSQDALRRLDDLLSEAVTNWNPNNQKLKRQILHAEARLWAAMQYHNDLDPLTAEQESLVRNYMTPTAKQLTYQRQAFNQQQINITEYRTARDAYKLAVRQWVYSLTKVRELDAVLERARADARLVGGPTARAPTHLTLKRAEAKEKYRLACIAKHACWLKFVQRAIRKS